MLKRAAISGNGLSTPGGRGRSEASSRSNFAKAWEIPRQVFVDLTFGVVIKGPKFSCDHNRTPGKYRRDYESIIARHSILQLIDYIVFISEESGVLGWRPQRSRAAPLLRSGGGRTIGEPVPADLANPAETLRATDVCVVRSRRKRYRIYAGAQLPGGIRSLVQPVVTVIGAAFGHSIGRLSRKRSPSAETS